MLKWISKIISRFRKPESILTLCGNIDFPPRGTKHFSQNTKVICFPPKWGDGYENIMVIGRHRNSKRYITIIMPSKRINNWRMKRVYEPHVIREMKLNVGWKESDSDKERLEILLASLLKRKVGDHS
jgi:hypothetical protein